MSAPPEKKMKVKSGSDDVDAPQEEEECSTISMVVGEEDCVSPITRIKGYPWRLRLLKRDHGFWDLLVRCEKSMEAELWDCEAVIENEHLIGEGKYKFESMDEKSQEHTFDLRWIGVGTRLDVEITPSEDGNRWRSRPIEGRLEPRDGILVIEDKKMYVNKQSLASQSSYFERLFNGDFKEKNMNEIPIADVSAEEFTNLIRMTYGENGGSVFNDLLTCENVHRVLELADRFDLKIVNDGVLNSLLSSSSPFSILERLLIAEQNDLTKCKDRIISQYTAVQMKELSEAPEYSQLSCETLHALFKKSCAALLKANEQLESIIGSP